ncbi:cilia- and flagella-associated protein 107-like [Liolophura sinensis]|uniref:cilia- and flagella-associated protein 107-like n=1 Tax=Liolophura sinensis TaxID=3198878 RepID=UPI0031590ED8
MSVSDIRKWNLPGWRIEQRFSPGVLIGNWAEERYSFKKGTEKHNSTHRIDFQPYAGHHPDVIIRRNGMLQNEGLRKEQLFSHHGGRYSNNMITWYDEQFNGRWHENKFIRPLREWKSHNLSWSPEKSDFPLQGDPTNYGLHGRLQQKWKAQIADETKGEFNSIYNTSYEPVDPKCMTKMRFANPRELSTSLLRVNNINKDLRFRGAPVALRQPEAVCLPSLKVPDVSC